MIRFINSQRKLILAAGLGLVVLSSPVMAQEAKDSKATAAKVVPATNTVSKTSNSGRVKKVSYSPASAKAKFVNSGVASYYGPGFHGRRTANGERFDMHAMTAAHRTLPFGTKLKVTNLSNGKSTIVRVNDRGPYAGNRVIDLSVAAAKQIGAIHSGVAKVSLEVVN